MDVRTLPRSVFKGYLRLARVPADAMTKVLGEAARDNAQLGLDRIDASVRHTAGRLFGDEVLVDEAARLRLAADERQRALVLRAEAGAKTAVADETFEQRRARAEAERARAAEEAEQRKQDAQRRAEQQRNQVEQAAGKSKAAVRNAAARAEAAIDADARDDRLTQLQRQEQALEEQEKALTAAEEAERLRLEAKASKARRKQAG